VCWCEGGCRQIQALLGVTLGVGLLLGGTFGLRFQACPPWREGGRGGGAEAYSRCGGHVDQLGDMHSCECWLVLEHAVDLTGRLMLCSCTGGVSHALYPCPLLPSFCESNHVFGSGVD
jgi:hypothetical protein